VAIYMMLTSNTTISDCRFEDCYDHVLLAISKVKNTRITGNYFLNTGKGLKSTFSIHCQCKDFYVTNNTLVNFGQGGIAVGTGVTDEDEGNAIYLYTKNDGTVVRYNRIHNYTGAHSNRGIYCDDGAYGFTLYGNIISGISNCNYIDSRLVPSEVLPTNTNNIIDYNIVEGRYKFEGNNKAGNGCIKGKNIVLSRKGDSPYNIVVNNFQDPVEDIHLEYIANRDLTIVVPSKTRSELRKLPIYGRIKKYFKVR